MSDVTQILSAIEEGDRSAAADLLPLVYEELRKLAGAKLARERSGQTLQATALVHEAYLRLVDHDEAQNWDSRGHFFAAAAEAMRRILVEQARRKGRIKRGAGRQRRGLEAVQLAEVVSDPEDLLALDEALAEFAIQRPQMAEVVKLRFFAGLSIPQVASTLSMSPATANRHWRYARAWLHQRLYPQGGENAR